MKLTERKKQIIAKLSMAGTTAMLFAMQTSQVFAETIGSLAWICGGGVILGASLIIAGIIVNVATNNTGSLLGGS